MARPRPFDRLLFVGDSITDCSRREIAPPLGGGFVHLVHAFHQARRPELPIEILNRGVGGDTVADLERRWQRDVIDERPDWVFVMIGVNDEIQSHLPEAPDRRAALARYTETYRSLLRRTLDALPAVRLVLLDPTPIDADPNSPWIAPMRERVEIVRGLAREFGALHVPTFDLLLDRYRRGPERDWLLDIPHPNLAGHAVIAEAVLELLECRGTDATPRRQAGASRSMEQGAAG